jgi:hypothetical protein
MGDPDEQQSGIEERHGAEGDRPPEDSTEEPGAEGGSDSPATDQPPALPSNDDSALGDTDQHSSG